MEAFVLLGGFAAIIVFGYFLMSRLDNWLAKQKPGIEAPAECLQIKVAASQPDSVPGISAALKELSARYPALRCTLLLGQEREVADALACGRVDLAIVSEHTAMSFAEYQDIALDTQPVPIMDGMVDMRTLGPGPAHQRLLWNGGKADPCLLELIRRLCRQPQSECAIIGPHGGRASHGSDGIAASH